MDEYLEKTFAEAFKREFDQEENVVRSLPFFAATLGVIIAAFQPVLVRFPHAALQAYECFAYILLIAAGGVFVWVLVCLVQAVRAADFQYPPAETEVLSWARELVAQKVAAGTAEASAEAETIIAVRRLYIDAYSTAASHNRLLTSRRTQYRTQGLVAMMILLGLASGLATAIFLHRQMARSAPGGCNGQGACVARKHDGKVQGGADQRAASGSTSSAQDDHGHPRREIPVRPGAREGGLQQVMNDKPKPDAPKVAPQAAQPVAPKMMVVRKSITEDANFGERTIEPVVVERKK